MYLAGTCLELTLKRLSLLMPTTLKNFQQAHCYACCLQLNILKNQNPPGQWPLKVPSVKFDFDVSVRHCMLSTLTSMSKSMLGAHLHATKRTHNFDFNNRFWPISALSQKPNIEHKFDVPYFQWFVSMTKKSLKTASFFEDFFRNGENKLHLECIIMGKSYVRHAMQVHGNCMYTSRT